jgi:hypothetical protein
MGKQIVVLILTAVRCASKQTEQWHKNRQKNKCEGQVRTVIYSAAKGIMLNKIYFEIRSLYL